MGHLIPAGTGFRTNHDIELVHLGEPSLLEEPATQDEAAL